MTRDRIRRRPGSGFAPPFRAGASRSIAGLAAGAAALALAAASAAEPPCTWELQAVPAAGVELLGAADDAAGGIWVVGSAPSAEEPAAHLNFVARWTGDGWDLPSAPQPAPPDRDQSLAGVAALGPDDAVAVGFVDTTDDEVFQPLSLRWDGAGWAVLEAPTFPAGGFFNAAARTGDAAWAVGQAKLGDPAAPIESAFAARLTTFGWQTLVLPPFAAADPQPEARYRLGAIGGTASDDVWVGGTLIRPGAPGQPAWNDAVVARWDGTTWTWFDLRPLLPAPATGSTITDIAAIAADDVWAVGRDFDVDAGRTVALLLHWDGTDWSRVEAPAEPVNVTLEAVVARASDDVYAAGTRFAFADGTSAWLLHFDGDGWTRLEDVQVVEGSEVLAAATAADGSLWLAGVADGLPDAGFAQRGVPCVPDCPGDVDGSGVIDLDDLVGLLAAWGTADPDADVDGSGVVDIDDLLVVLGTWGDCG